MIAVLEKVGNAVDPEGELWSKARNASLSLSLNATDHRSPDSSIDPTTIAMLH
jgi:hypothetical protein